MHGLRVTAYHTKVIVYKLFREFTGSPKVNKIKLPSRIIIKEIAPIWISLHKKSGQKKTFCLQYPVTLKR
jgi:hypothetical protein